MFARTLDVRSYRNYRDYELELSPAVTILHGPNAVGKTNLVEALQLLTTGASFRKPLSAELVSEGASEGRIHLLIEGDGRRIDIDCEIREGKRTFKKNGKKCSAASVRGVLPSVLFCPDDLDMVKRSARVRREAIDGFGVQLSAPYARLLAEYERAVEQRNALLKESFADAALMASWNEHLADRGTLLLKHRMALLERILPHFRSAYASISAGEKADVTYCSTVGALTGTEISIAQNDELYRLFLGCLEERSDDERRRGVTLLGPHRDELVFSIEGRNARSFASQGQQRSLVLAWKIAEVRVAYDVLGTYPLLLLDDVMSELDAARREAFLAFIEGKIQTVITTTNLGYFSERVLDVAKVVNIGGSN